MSYEAREQFEKWYTENFKTVPDDWFEQEKRYYYGGHTQGRWESWQAGRLAGLEEAAKIAEHFLWRNGA